MALDLVCLVPILRTMNKLLLPFLALVTLPMLSCTTSEPTAQSPISLESDDSTLPWNRPTGPEGGGALGFLGQ